MNWRGYLVFAVIIFGLQALLSIAGARAESVTVMYGVVEKRLDFRRFEARLFGETFVVQIAGVEPDKLQFCRAYRPKAALGNWYANAYLQPGIEVAIEPVSAWDRGAIVARVSVIVQSGKWADLRTLIAVDTGITAQPFAKPCARA